MVRRDKSRLLYLHSIFIALSLCSGCCLINSGQAVPLLGPPRPLQRSCLPPLWFSFWGQPLPRSGGCKWMVKTEAALTCRSLHFSHNFSFIISICTYRAMPKTKGKAWWTGRTKLISQTPLSYPCYLGIKGMDKGGSLPERIFSCDDSPRSGSWDGWKLIFCAP